MFRYYQISQILEIKTKNPFPNDKCRLFQNDNFDFDENGRKFSKQEENTVGKGEIAHYEQFLLFPQCFQKTCTADK